MDESLNVLPTISPRVKRIVVRTLVWGFGFGVGIGLIVLAIMFYLERPKGWDTKSLDVYKRQVPRRLESEAGF